MLILIALLYKNDIFSRTIGTRCPTTTSESIFDTTDEFQFAVLLSCDPGQRMLRCDKECEDVKMAAGHASTTTKGGNEEGTTMFLLVSPV